VQRKKTGVVVGDFSRIRKADLSRFTVDRLIAVINKLWSRVEVGVKLRPADSPWNCFSN
jgi:hypothetical protein